MGYSRKKSLVVPYLLQLERTNNMMFPIAKEVVEGENQQSWIWFLVILYGDLNMSDGLG